MSYKSTHTGAQIDAGVAAALNPDATPSTSSTALITSGAVAAGLADKASNADVALKAPIASPALTGTPTAPTPTAGDDSNKIATTAFVGGEIATESAATEQKILALYPTDSISNQPVASFADGADGIPVKALTVNIDPVQEGSGDPSPDNVRPISGWGSVSLGQTLAGYVMPTIEQGGINAGGDETTALDRCRSDYVTAPVESGKAFFAVTGNDVRVIAIHRYYADKTRRDRISYGYVKSGYIDISGNNFTIKYLRFVLAKSDGNSNIIPSDIENLVVAPYSSISLGQTVYGGTLTDNGDGTWTLTITHGSVDMGAASWTKSSGMFRVSISDGVMPADDNTAFDAICSCYVAVSWNSGPNPCIMGRNGYAWVYDTTYADSTATQFATAMAGQKFAYPLATPVSYTLTAESVRTLLGQNNIFADCGDINALTYRADVGLYIDKKLAEA